MIADKNVINRLQEGYSIKSHLELTLILSLHVNAKNVNLSARMYNQGQNSQFGHNIPAQNSQVQFTTERYVL